MQPHTFHLFPMLLWLSPVVILIMLWALWQYNRREQGPGKLYTTLLLLYGLLFISPVLRGLPLIGGYYQDVYTGLLRMPFNFIIPNTWPFPTFIFPLAIIFGVMLLLLERKVGFYVVAATIAVYDVVVLLLEAFYDIPIIVIQYIVLIAILRLILMVKTDGVREWKRLKRGWGIKDNPVAYTTFICFTMLLIAVWIVNLSLNANGIRLDDPRPEPPVQEVLEPADSVAPVVVDTVAAPAPAVETAKEPEKPKQSATKSTATKSNGSKSASGATGSIRSAKERGFDPNYGNAGFPDIQVSGKSGTRTGSGGIKSETPDGVGKTDIE